MKELKKFVKELPNGTKFVLHINSIGCGANIYAVYETHVNGHVDYDCRRFNETSKYRTLEDNIARARSYYKMKDSQVIF